MFVCFLFQVSPDTKRHHWRNTTRCGEQNGDLFKRTSRFILVSSRYKALFCYVPKVACSNWKSVFLVLQGYFNTTEINRPLVHRMSLRGTLRRYSKSRVVHMLQTYKKVAFVREPMERIVSAYQNKFAQDYEGRKYHQKFGKSIIMKYRKNFTGEVTDEHYTKFNEFVQYLIDLPPNEDRNEHWERQHKLCSPCMINYDFIGKYDTLKSDAARALELMGASDVVTFPEKRKKPQGSLDTTALMKTFFSMISEEEFVQLRDAYNEDYEIFGFHKPTYSEVIGSL